MDKSLRVGLTLTATRQTLVVVDNLPGAGVDLFPAQLRALAAALLVAADDCDTCVFPRNGSVGIRREYPLR